MKRLTITEENGLWKVETSDGQRTSGASFDTALDKLVAPYAVDPFELSDVFDHIRDTPSGQIAHGQASG